MTVAFVSEQLGLDGKKKFDTKVSFGNGLCAEVNHGSVLNMLWRILFFGVLTVLPWAVFAQIGVRVVPLEKGYMRWSPTVMGIEVVNVGGEPVLLRSLEDRSWLRFLVRRGNLASPGMMVRQVQSFEQPDLALEPGETARFRFDLTPFYSIRELGPYVVQAVVRLPGAEETDLLSDALEISVVPGRVIWSSDYGGGGVPRKKMSLLRHVSGAEERLFAQIESPDEGLVYLCRPLGRLTLGIMPQSGIDALGNWSILFRSGPKQFDFFEFSSIGELLQFERLVQFAEPPRLVGGPGGYVVQGGARPEEMADDTLRSTQPQFGGAAASPQDVLPDDPLPSTAGAARSRPAVRESSPGGSSGDGPKVRRGRS